MGYASVSSDGDDAVFHNQAGAFSGRTSMLNAQDLWQRYCRTRASPSLPKFCSRMIHLIRQHKHETPSSLTSRQHLLREHHQRALPLDLASALRACFSLTAEMFASPLNVHPGMQFWSACRGDADLHGAMYNAFSSPWSGAALVHPEIDDAALASAARWAIDATGRAPPSTFIFVAPHWPHKKFHKLLSNSGSAHILCSFAAKRLMLRQHSLGPVPVPPKPANSATNLWIVANPAGLDAHFHRDQLDALRAAVAAACAPNPGSAPAFFAPTPTVWSVEDASRGRTRSPRTPHPLRRAAPTPAHDHMPQHHPALPWPHPAPLLSRPRAFKDAAAVVYTDGSRNPDEPNCGCGVFRASAPLSASFQFSGGDQSVMRAELAAEGFSGEAGPLWHRGGGSGCTLPPTRPPRTLDPPPPA